MMQTIEQIFEQGVEQWRLSKGIGTALVPNTIDDRYFVLTILQRIYARSPNADVLIIVESFSERSNIVEFITHQDDEDNNKEFGNLLSSHKLKILTHDFVALNGYKGYPTLFIGYHIANWSKTIDHCIDCARFKLIVLNKLFVTNAENTELYKRCPVLNAFKTYEVSAIRSSLPVEETWIGVTIEDDETKKLYDYYSKYIETTINIFGSFDVLQKVKYGDSTNNISATQLCLQIAKENGWNEHLDMSIEYNRQIDELYNPNALSERARLIYEYIRNRNIIATDYRAKLDKILEIVNENKDKKILIINKRGDFAKVVTDYLNNNSETNICGDYHDKVENIPAVDMFDNPIYYKSGAKKGERKYMGVQMQKTINEAKFNSGKLRVLSTSASPDKDLAIAVDIVIITSPLCEGIRNYMYRLSNVKFNGDKIRLYSVFCLNTTEEREIRNRDSDENILTLNKCEYDNIGENNFAFYIGD